MTECQVEAEIIYVDFKGTDWDKIEALDNQRSKSHEINVISLAYIGGSYNQSRNIQDEKWEGFSEFPSKKEDAKIICSHIEGSELFDDKVLVGEVITVCGLSGGPLLENLVCNLEDD